MKYIIKLLIIILAIPFIAAGAIFSFVSLAFGCGGTFFDEVFKWANDL